MKNEEQSRSNQESLKISSKIKDPLFLRDLYLDVNERLLGKNHLKSTLINPYEDIWKE